MSQLIVAVFILLAVALTGCDDESTTLAPYEGSRPLIVRTVTKSAVPDIEWVGGRVAAIGVNEGDRAALDETLVWLTTTDDNALSSPIQFGTESNVQMIESLGGTPQDSLSNDTRYTVWVAEIDAFDEGLDTTRIDPFSLGDSTLVLTYQLRGRSAGDPSLGVDFVVTRDQKLLEDRYIIYWTPASQPFRRIVINAGSTGSIKSGVKWHIVEPDEDEDFIRPPVVIGEPPEGTLQVTKWAGFEVSNHILWAQTSEWDGESYGLRTPGYAQFLIFKNNFE